MATNILMRNPLPSHVLVMLLSTLLIVSMLRTPLATASSTKDYENYIQTACKPTLYRKLCYQSLSPYALKIKGDPQTLCKTALTITLQAARNASSTISKQLKQKGLTKLEGQVIEDCDSNIKDSIDELQQSLNAMKLLSGPDRAFQLDNIKTWVSAALTDDTTCTDEFDQEGQEVRATIKNTIRNMVSNIAQMTSNALALINNQLK
ncbi:21 kDa protein [Morella rubra]|uniref:21 kDa protein n=1 Tax=Morella rubra TaxID=262757 RepID=A0A6A1UW42_9ROSI|nr:21 kDa protein [Morella rubra]KAB1210842.1 21 kDa protein [Morella rubra]